MRNNANANLSLHLRRHRGYNSDLETCPPTRSRDEFFPAWEIKNDQSGKFFDAEIPVESVAADPVGYAAWRPADAWPAAVERALAQAGKNRSNLEQVLRHFEHGKDRQKYDAACFLIRNMLGHGYSVFALKDAGGAVVPFDALKYPGFAQARQALAELEAKHGNLDFAPDKRIGDLETVTADYLIDDIDLAFRTWREKPWARSLSFDAFCEYVLPYRASREPLERWRAACEIPTADIVSQMKDSSDPREAAAVVMKYTKHHLGFNELYYLHPTDQGFAEMCRTRIGRCGDMANLQIYVYRAERHCGRGRLHPLLGDSG